VGLAEKVEDLLRARRLELLRGDGARRLLDDREVLFELRLHLSRRLRRPQAERALRFAPEGESALERPREAGAVAGAHPLAAGEIVAHANRVIGGQFRGDALGVGPEQPVGRAGARDRRRDGLHGRARLGFFFEPPPDVRRTFGHAARHRESERVGAGPLARLHRSEPAVGVREPVAASVARDDDRGGRCRGVVRRLRRKALLRSERRRDLREAAVIPRRARARGHRDGRQVWTRRETAGGALDRGAVAPGESVSQRLDLRHRLLARAHAQHEDRHSRRVRHASHAGEDTVPSAASRNRRCF
jgi:hypothetical protein